MTTAVGETRCKLRHKACGERRDSRVRTDGVDGFGVDSGNSPVTRRQCVVVVAVGPSVAGPRVSEWIRWLDGACNGPEKTEHGVQVTETISRGELVEQGKGWQQ